MAPRQQEKWEAEHDARVRVLVECAPQRSPSIVASLLEREGFDVRTCEGPAAHACDLLEHGSCSLVSGADVVVNMLGAEPHGREVVEAVATVRRPPAVVAELTSPQAIALAVDGGGALDADGVVVVETPVTRRSLLAAIDEALVARERTGPMWGDGCP